MSAAQTTLRLGTRGSLLARTQSQLVASELEKLHKGLQIELVIIRTSGDKITTKPLHEFGGKGLFTKELENALLQNQIDFAVHSFKDVPVTMPLIDTSDLVFAAVPAREDPRDVMVSLKARSIAELPQNARVATGSLRRRSQLLELRPDLIIEPVRGNIDTRLRKLRNDQFDALILAAAGLRRTRLFDEDEMVVLPPEQILPAPGQGALALQCRKGDANTQWLLASIDDHTAHACVTAERDLVAALHGDCHSPIAALAEIRDSAFTLRAAVGGRDGRPPILKASGHAPVASLNDAVEAVHKSLVAQGVTAQLAVAPELADPIARNTPDT